MGCQKSLDFSGPPAADAHLSFYWTMDEAGDLNKVDSTSGTVWTTSTGTSSPPGLFVNGVQLDAQFGSHGLGNGNDTAFAFDATTSKGISVWFWFKKTANYGGVAATFFQWFIDCHDNTFTNDAELLIFTSFLGPWTVRHRDFTASMDYDAPFVFNPTLGTWHMIGVTIDLVAHTLNSYLDGVLVSTAPDVGLFYTTPKGDITLDCTVVAPFDNTLTVLVDELGLSLKGALNQAQITALYNGGAGVTWPLVQTIVPFP